MAGLLVIPEMNAPKFKQLLAHYYESDKYEEIASFYAKMLDQVLIRL